MHKKIIGFILAVLILGCADKPDNSGQSSDASANNQSQGRSQHSQYPPMPASEINMLKEKVTSIDLVFTEGEASFEIAGQEEIQTDLAIIGQGGASITPGCEHVNMAFYKVGGEIIYYGEVFFAPGCNYIIFYKDGQIKYVNQLSEAGMQHYPVILEQIRAMRAKFDRLREEGYE
jgi:hypothetical protein